MTMQIQQRYAGVHVNPEECWNVNLVTVLSKLVMAFVIFTIYVVVSTIG